MDKYKPPFKFEISKIYEQIKSIPLKVDGITISIPFLSLSVKPNSVERDVAREILIRMGDKRVLNSSQCCDSCSKPALESVFEIRKTLVDMQVKLMNVSENALFFLIELMVESIRQFITNIEHTKRDSGIMDRDKYLSSFEMLRAHLHLCLRQVEKIAEIQYPKIYGNMQYESWDERAYEELEHGNFVNERLMIEG